MKVEDSLIRNLSEIAKKVRINILKSLNKAGSGHTGGSLSTVEVLVSLYFHVMRVDPQNPDDPDRDRFVLSKGHSAPALYTVLAERGFFSVEELWRLRRLLPDNSTGREYCPSILQGHPDRKKTPGVEVSTGALGQGLSMGVGMALAGKLNKRSYRVYVLMGDGELQEGQIWEAVMSASHFRLDNLCGIVDNNGLQIDGEVKDVMNIEPLSQKFSAFGWHTIEVDGHSFSEVISAFRQAKVVREKPTVIIAKTIKGKGVSIFEHKVKYHGIAPTDEELEIALKELKEGNDG